MTQYDNHYVNLFVLIMKKRKKQRLQFMIDFNTDSDYFYSYQHFKSSDLFIKSHLKCFTVGYFCKILFMASSLSLSLLLTSSLFDCSFATNAYIEVPEPDIMTPTAILFNSLVISFFNDSKYGLQVKAGFSKSLTNRPSVADCNAPFVTKQSNKLSGTTGLQESNCNVLHTKAVDNPSIGLNT